jgi:hypothetical protein
VSGSCAIRRVAVRLAVLLLVGIVGASPVAAYSGRTDPGRVFFSSDGSLYYHKGTAMLGPLGVFVLLFAALVSDDDEDYSSDWETRDHGSGCCGMYGEPSFPLEAFQLGSSAGVFVTPNVAVGLRGVAQGNGREDPVRSFWGGGPELSWYPGNPWNPLRPFVSLSALFTRGRIAEVARERLVGGPSYQVRTGLSFFGEGGGVFVQASHQTQPLDRQGSIAHTRSGWGAGMGVTFFLD